MKILIAEDTGSVAAVMTARLSNAGHTVVVAEDGRIALEKFKQYSPDLVLMDIDMPIMDGFQATAAIRDLESERRRNDWTPVIFLTASATDENLLTAIDAGGDDFMAKTVSEEILHARMRAMARIARLRHALADSNRQLADANRQLARLANHDGLTGLNNRRHLDELVDAAWDGACRAQAPFAALMIDVDNFKKYNDRYGHQPGDECLIVVAGAIKTVVDAVNAAGSTRAIAGRYGGEEFSVVLPAATVDETRKLATAIGAKIGKLKLPHEANADWGIVTVSIGAAHIATAKGSPAVLFRQADQRLYAAKARGRNCAEFTSVQPD